MPTRSVNLTDELDRFVSAKVESGRYESASEVVQEALRTLEQEEQEDEAKLIALRAAIDEGMNSGIAEDGVFDRVLSNLKAKADKLEAAMPLQRQENSWLLLITLRKLRLI